MARLILPIAGAAVGFAFGGGFQGAQLGWSVGSVLGAAFGPKQRSAGPRLDDRRVLGSDYGTVIPYIEGSARVAGIIAYASIKRETATTQSQGKGGGGAEYTSYTYDVDLLIIVSSNIIPGIAQVFMNGDLAYDGAETREGLWDDIRFYTGDDSQMPDPTYEAAVGTDNALAYTRRGSVFIQSLKLGTSGQIPNLTFVIGNPGVVDPIDVLLTRFEGATTNDISTYEHGPATITGAVSVNDGAMVINYFPASTLVDAAFVSEDYRAELSVPCLSYEFLFTLNFGGVFATHDLLSISPGFTGQYWTVRTNGNNFFQFLSFAGGIFAGSSFILSEFPIAGIDCHLAVQIYNDDTISVFFNGIRYKNRVSAGISYSANSSAGLNIGSVSSSLSTPGMNATFTGIRIAQTEIYTTATYDPPATLESLDGMNPGTLVTEPVQDVVSRLMTRAGYAATEYDASDLASVTRPVRSLVVSQISTTATIIEILAAAYFIEYYCTDKVYFTVRGGVAAATIPYDSLRVDTSRESEVEPFPLVNGNELEIPARIFLSYANTLNDFQRGMEPSDRAISSQRSDNQIELPIGLEPDEAKAVATSMLLDQVAELPRATISLGIEYSALRPTNVINVTAKDGNVYRMRIVSRKDTGGVFTLELVGDDSTVFIPVGGTDNNYVPQVIQTIAATEWVLIDGPIGQDQDDTPGYYVAAKPGDGDLWPGAVVVESFDGANYSQSAVINNKAVFGVCTSTLPDFTDGFVFDEISTLTVDVMSGELSSSTRSALLDDQTVNAAAIGSYENGWEYVQFRTATMTAPGLYTLTGFMRGRKGSEQFTGTHAAADYFVLLDAATLRRTTAINSEIGLARDVKVVTTNLALASVTAQDFTNTGVGLKPYAPANPTALKSGSDLSITAQRRTRLTARYGGIPGTSVPLGEATEAYRIRVYDGATLVRTINTTSLPYTYASADITADGFASSDTITFTMSQVSQSVGDGFLSTFTGIAP